MKINMNKGCKQQASMVQVAKKAKKRESRLSPNPKPKVKTQENAGTVGLIQEMEP